MGRLSFVDDTRVLEQAVVVASGIGIEGKLSEVLVVMLPLMRLALPRLLPYLVSQALQVRLLAAILLLFLIPFH